MTPFDDGVLTAFMLGAANVVYFNPDGHNLYRDMGSSA